MPFENKELEIQENKSNEMYVTIKTKLNKQTTFFRTVDTLTLN
jgi:hypothetical protein